jgi:hypothetical protein
MAFPEDLPRPLPDRMIRESLQTPANLRDFLRDCVPDIADRLDYSRLRPLEREMLTDDWWLRAVDLLFEVPYVDEAAASALVAVLIEHQSDTDPFVPLRTLLTTLGYWERAWREWEAMDRPRPPFVLRPVVPIVLYTGSVSWGSKRSIAEMLGQPAAPHPFAPTWRPLFWSLAERTPEHLLASGPWMQLLTVMRVSGEESARFLSVCAEAIRRLVPIRDTEHVRWSELLGMMLTYAVWRRPESERQALREIAEKENPANKQEVDAVVETGGEYLMRQGATREALRRARLTLRRVLESRFGALPERLVQEIEATDDVSKLDEAFERALRLEKLEDFHW